MRRRLVRRHLKSMQKLYANDMAKNGSAHKGSRIALNEIAPAAREIVTGG
jgi:hypothetical protein